MSLVSYGLSRNVLARGNDTLPGSVCITVFTLLLIISPVVFFVLLDFFLAVSRSVLHHKDQRWKLLLVISFTFANVFDFLFFFLFLFLYET